MSHHHGEPGSPGVSGNELTFHEKGSRLLDHWIRHNAEHARSYREWAAVFHEHQFSAAAEKLETAAALSEQINAALSDAAAVLASEDGS